MIKLGLNRVLRTWFRPLCIILHIIVGFVTSIDKNPALLYGRWIYGFLCRIPGVLSRQLGQVTLVAGRGKAPL